jgi:hypothetical protein
MNPLFLHNLFLAVRLLCYLERVTVSVTVVVLVRPPPMPMTVRLNVPVGVLLDVLTVRVDEVVAGLGLNEPVAPDGNPLTLIVTGPLNPPLVVIVTV